MRDRRHIILFVSAAAIMLLAALLRFPNLGDNPPGFWQDEASTGLDAWLLWNTGRDRAGELLPLIARSFGDYPLAGYRYLTAPVVGLFGPTIGNERLVAAIFGTLCVAAAGVIAWIEVDWRAGLGTLISAALCPTWLHFSRYGSEAILLPASLAIGWAAIAFARRTATWWTIWAGAASLGFALYTYHAVKLFMPLWMIGFLWLQWPFIRDLWTHGRKKHVIGPALLFTAIVLPSVILAFSDGGLARGRTVLAWYHFETDKVPRIIASNFLSYFDPGMLFIRGGPAAAQQIPGLGMWNAMDLVPMIVAFFVMVRTPALRRFSIFVAYWFLIGPLPGGVTYESHNMGRAIAWLPAPQIISGLGTGAMIAWGWHRFRETKVLDRARGALVLLFLAGGWLATSYGVYWCTLVRYPKIAQRDFQFDVSRGLRCAREKRKDEKLIVSHGFPVASVFAAFLLGDLDAEKGTPVWELGQRTAVAEGELYVFPARLPKPTQGSEVCRIVHLPTGQPAAYVYGPPR